jgi:hypothetical protein
MTACTAFLSNAVAYSYLGARFRLPGMKRLISCLDEEQESTKSKYLASRVSPTYEMVDRGSTILNEKKIFAGS